MCVCVCVYFGKSINYLETLSLTQTFILSCHVSFVMKGQEL